MSTVVEPIRRVETSPQYDTPDRIFALVKHLDEDNAAILATQAVNRARSTMPRLSGNSAANLGPISGEGYYGIRWMDNHVWFQEQGIRPFTMRNLAGKTIPMWVNDPTGETARKNPKAKTRVTADGRRQVQIFRRVGKIGARRTQKLSDGSLVDNGPQSYPGAPGRISMRTPPRWWSSPGRVSAPGRIAKGNVGVRWRHSGLPGAHFMHDAIIFSGQMHGIDGVVPVYSTHQKWRGGIA